MSIKVLREIDFFGEESAVFKRVRKCKKPRLSKEGSSHKIRVCEKSFILTVTRNNENKIGKDIFIKYGLDAPIEKN